MICLIHRMVLSQHHGGDKNSRAPERPTHQRQQRRGDGRSPGHFHRRQSNPSTGSGTTMTMAPTASAMSGLSTPSRHQTPGRQSTGSGSVSGRSRSGSIGGCSSSHGGGGGGGSHEEGGVRVVVRVRPLSEEDEAKGGERTMRCCNPKALEFTSTPALAASAAAAAATAAGGGAGSGSEGAGGGGVVGEGSRQYAFDLCAHEGFDQEEMFQSCGLMPLLSAAINGYAGVRATTDVGRQKSTYVSCSRGDFVLPSCLPPPVSASLSFYPHGLAVSTVSLTYLRNPGATQKGRVPCVATLASYMHCRPRCDDRVSLTHPSTVASCTATRRSFSRKFTVVPR